MGFWLPLCKVNIPRTTFLKQETLAATRHLVANSDLPAFNTAVAASRVPAPEGRVVIPIRDDEASVRYHFVVPAASAAAFEPLFAALAQTLPCG